MGGSTSKFFEISSWDEQGNVDSAGNTPGQLNVVGAVMANDRLGSGLMGPTGPTGPAGPPCPDLSGAKGPVGVVGENPVTTQQTDTSVAVEGVSAQVKKEVAPLEATKRAETIDEREERIRKEHDQRNEREKWFNRQSVEQEKRRMAIPSPPTTGTEALQEATDALAQVLETPADMISEEQNRDNYNTTRRNMRQRNQARRVGEQAAAAAATRAMAREVGQEAADVAALKTSDNTIHYNKTRRNIRQRNQARRVGEQAAVVAATRAMARQVGQEAADVAAFKADVPSERSSEVPPSADLNSMDTIEPVLVGNLQQSPVSLSVTPARPRAPSAFVPAEPTLSQTAEVQPKADIPIVRRLSKENLSDALGNLRLTLTDLTPAAGIGHPPDDVIRQVSEQTLNTGPPHAEIPPQLRSTTQLAKESTRTLFGPKQTTRRRTNKASSNTDTNNYENRPLPPTPTGGGSYRVTYKKRKTPK